MDTILYNGNFCTLDNAYQNPSAMAIKDGIILKMGSDEEILPLAEPNSEVVDLKKKLVMPGFIDTHMHILFYASFKDHVDLVNAKSYKEVVEACRERAAKAREKKSAVMACNFNQMNWSDVQKMPDRHDLDAVASDIPIVMQRVCGHIVCLNTKALEIAGLWDEEEGTTKETIDFGEDGRPNGYARENTAMRIQAVFEKYGVKEIKKLIEDACKDVVSKGITQINSDDFNLLAEDDFLDVIQAYKELCEEDRLPIRVVEQGRLSTFEQLKEFLDLGYRLNDSFGHFKFGPIKILGDGSLGSHSAAMREPYKNDPGTKGILVKTDEEMYEFVKLAYKNGYPIATHCIGDAALEQICNVLDKVCREFPQADKRNGIVHCQIMDEKLQDRFKELNLIAYVQPVFIKSDSQIVDACVGSDLGKQSYNWARFKELGITMCGGSDSPVEPFDILPNMYYAVTRKPSLTAEPWYPENGVNLQDAVKMFTKDAAYASYDENVLGTLSIGKYADLVVLDKDIFANDISELLNTKIEMTMVGGKVVYRGGN